MKRYLLTLAINIPEILVSFACLVFLVDRFMADSDENDYAESADYDRWGDGTEEQLAAQARERISQRFDTRPGGAGDAFAWKCARNVLKYLGTDE
jgi:hypothetical protein